MNPESKLSNKTKLLIFAVALALRVGYVLIQYKFGMVVGAFLAGDSPFYIEIANNILAGNGFASQSGPTAYVTPGFPLFLAGCFAIFGDNLIWISLIQCVLSASVCVFLALIATIIFDKKVGLIAGIIAAIYYELILWTSGQILTEPLYTFLLAAAVYVLIAAVTTEKSVNLKFALAGLLFGISALVRPLAFAVALGLGLTMIFVSLIYARQKVLPAFLFIVICLLTIQPWGIRNYFVFNKYLLTSSESGHVFWLGNNPEYDLYEHPDFERFGGYTVMFKAPPELILPSGSQRQIEKNAIYADQAWQHIYTHPAAFLVRATHKTWNMWRPTFSGSSFQNKLISFSLYPLLLLLSLAGIYLAWHLKTEKFNIKNLLLNLASPAGLLCVFLLIHLFLHACITGEIRFRVPLWIALIPFASVTVVKVFAYLKTLQKEKISG